MNVAAVQKFRIMQEIVLTVSAPESHDVTVALLEQDGTSVRIRVREVVPGPVF